MNHEACAKRIIEPAIKDCNRRIIIRQAVIRQAKKTKKINLLLKEEI